MCIKHLTIIINKSSIRLSFELFLIIFEMRPDKKKKVHHDSRKKAEKAKQTTLSEQGQTKESVEKVQDVVGAKVDDKDPPKDEKSIKGRSTKVVEEKPPKNISSNWTKFEIPSSDEDENEDTLTGLNFNFVLENKGL